MFQLVALDELSLCIKMSNKIVDFDPPVLLLLPCLMRCNLIGNQVPCDIWYHLAMAEEVRTYVYTRLESMNTKVLDWHYQNKAYLPVMV